MRDVMTRSKRRTLSIEAERRNMSQLATLGGEIRNARRRRRASQRALAAKAGIGQATLSRLERGRGGSLSLDSWQRVALALGRDLRIELSRDPLEEPADVGHLGIQELLLRLAARVGMKGSFELPTRPADPARSADVGLRDDRRRRLILVEAWNTIGDIGAAVRSTDRKLVDAARLAVAVGAERPYAVHGSWIVRATARNRELVGRYPHVFATRFPGSSAGWLRALTAGTPPPAEPGLVWCDLAATRLFAWRRRPARRTGAGATHGGPA
jgi:transcriptional regulator with XRE-family HTH domain